ncbi:hypothetical protein GCM10023205_11860 [Yinghuangia aomiensis]|uniref:PPM-type phosphatase domain-containing protein n=1 Tax=Yinghuangia aomiensis TaxID=676205 RepID=A0ABP9GWR5_9ACTN
MSEALVRQHSPLAAAASAGPVRRSVYVLLAVAASVYVIGPVLRAAALPDIRADLGLTPGDVATAEVIIVAVGVLALYGAGRAGDVWGRRRVVRWSLAALAAGYVALACSTGPTWYFTARVLVSAASAAVFITSLASVSALNLPGRMSRVVGGWIALVTALYFAAVHLARPAISVLGWRATALLLAAVAVTACAAARWALPQAAAPRAGKPIDSVLAACATAAAALGSGLYLVPVRGWTDRWVLLFLAGAAGAAAVGFLRARASGVGRDTRLGFPVRASACALASGMVLGFAQFLVPAIVTPLTLGSGASLTGSTVAVSAFSVGGIAACLTVQRRSVTPLTGCSVGFPMAAVGLVLLRDVPGSGWASVGMCSFAAALTGFGLMTAMVPQLAAFLARVPRSRLGASAALHPTAVLLGAAVAQALDAESRLWAGIGVAALAAVVAGRPAVAMATFGVTGLQYLAVLGLAGADRANRPVTGLVCLGVGVAAGLAMLTRRQQAERLARLQRSMTALRHAVLHSVPRALGRLQLAGLYQPATADSGVGGDFVEAVHTPFGARILIGDVRGKGLAAVQTVADLLGTFRSQAHDIADLGELVCHLDRQLARSAAAGEDDELFATALIVQHDEANDSFEMVNCGHLAPLVVSSDGVREVRTSTLLPLGFGTLCALGGGPRPEPVLLPADATLVLHTDGLSEARNSSGEFYPLTERLAASASLVPEHLLGHLERDVQEWTHQLVDDIAVIALTRPGAGNPVPHGPGIAAA